MKRPTRGGHGLAARLAEWLHTVVVGGLLFGLGGLAQATSWMVTLPNGHTLNIVEGATANASGFYLERRYANGGRDAQFGSSGRTFFTLGHDNHPPATLQVDSVGRILVSGSSDAGNGRYAVVVLRFLPTGQVDASWGQVGRSLIAAPGTAPPDQRTTDPPRANANAADTLPLADGQVLVVGTVDDDQKETAALWRLTPNGQLDAAFGTAGVLLATALPQSQGLAVQQDADGALQIALQASLGDKTWLEVHRWAAGAPGPVRAARQELPEDWVGPPALARSGGTWVWLDTSQPSTPPLPLVTAAPESLWSVSSTVAPAPRTEAAATTPTAGHAVVNPFSPPGLSDAASVPLALDDLAWPGMLLLIGALLAAAFWWWWRSG